MTIRFGTSGWRAIIAEEFTFNIARLVTQAIANYLDRQGVSGPVVVGHDTRFLAERYASECAHILRQNGIRVLLCEQPVPTPTVAYAILAERALAGVTVTASHNPPEYQGIKFSTADGAPAPTQVTRKIEAEVRRLQCEGAADALPVKAVGELMTFNPRAGYLKELSRKIDFNRIANAKLRIAVDPMWGTGRGYLNRALSDAGCEVKILHDWRDPLFGGGAPDPSEDHLSELKETVVSGGYHLGLALDGDADRFGVIDRTGRFISPNQSLALLCDYLCESRGWQGAVARSVSTSHQIDRVAWRRGIEVIETPVGFKFIGELIKQDKLILGGEENGGLSIKGHYPEKDGILACLLVAEMVAATGASLKELLDDLYAKDGRLWNARIGMKLTEEMRARFSERWSENQSQRIAGRVVTSTEQVDDGVKLVLDNGSWMLLRLSTTEPIVRCCIEATSEVELNELLEASKRLVI